MKKDFKVTFSNGYDQADTIIQIMQLDARIASLEEAVKNKKAGRPFDLLLLAPVFFPEIKQTSPGFDIAQVDAYIKDLKDRMTKLELELR